MSKKLGAQNEGFLAPHWTWKLNRLKNFISDSEDLSIAFPVAPG